MAPKQMDLVRVGTKSTHRKFVLSIGVPIAIALAATLAWLLLPREGAIATILNPQAITAPDTAVDETKPDENAFLRHKALPDQPRYLRIPGMSLRARVIPIGTLADNRLAAPTNIFDAGWYKLSSKPSDQGGAILLDGHYAGPTKQGLFGSLDSLKKGDAVSVEQGNGKTVNFKVVKVIKVPKDRVDAASLLISVDTSRLGLNIISCHGSYDSRTKDFPDRLIVYATAAN